MIKKVLAALVGVLVVVVVGSAPVAIASVEIAAAPHCQHGSTYGRVVDDEPVKTGSGTTIGLIELCRDSSNYYWGFLLLNNPPTASQWGQAAIARYDGWAYFSSVDCDSPGGNGYVKPGQTRCWTPKFNGQASRWNFAAVGSVTSSHTGEVYASAGTIIQR